MTGGCEALGRLACCGISGRPCVPGGPLFPPGGVPGSARLLTVDSITWAWWPHLVPGLGGLSEPQPDLHGPLPSPYLEGTAGQDRCSRTLAEPGSALEVGRVVWGQPGASHRGCLPSQGLCALRARARGSCQVRRPLRPSCPALPTARLAGPCPVSLCVWWPQARASASREAS